MTYKAILEVIDQWPSTKRLTLIQDILHTLMPPPAKRRRNTLEKALGLLATSEPPPSDKDVERWLNEGRMELSLTPGVPRMGRDPGGGHPIDT
jgi:hypothetical protein